MAKCNFKLQLPSFRICRSKKPSSLPKNPSKLPLPAIFIPVIPPKMLLPPPSAKPSHPLPRFLLMSGCISKSDSVYVSNLSNTNTEPPALPKLCNSPVSEDLEEIPLPAVSFSSADGGRSGPDEEELISSSSSFDSSSDFGFAPKTNEKRKKKKGKAKRQSTMAMLPEDKSAAAAAEEKKVKMNESYAVTKKSEDPYDDFKKSMMEMIVDKDLSEPEELEDLLMCFLSLNAKEHHAVILEAFSEVWDESFSTVYFPSSRLISSLSK